jgi:hypothetical protein
MTALGFVLIALAVIILISVANNSFSPLLKELGI